MWMHDYLNQYPQHLKALEYVENNMERIFKKCENIYWKNKNDLVIHLYHPNNEEHLRIDTIKSYNSIRKMYFTVTNK